MMAQTSGTVAVLLLIVAVSGEIALNDTKSAVFHGEQGVAESAIRFDRRLLDGQLEFVNGHNQQPLTDDKVTDWVNGSGKLEKGVLETQQTTCQITTEQLVATAQATVTRVLKGLCTSEELTRQFHVFSDLVKQRLDHLDSVIAQIDSRVDDYNEALKLGKYQQIETLVPNCDNTKPVGTALSDAEVKHTELDYEKRPLADVFETGTGTGTGPGPGSSVREPEIQKYNSTIHIEPAMSGPPKKVFTYYWKIPDAKYSLTEMNPRRSVRSQSFYIYHGGYRLYLRSYPRQKEVNFSIHVGVTKGDFDAVLKWPFSHKMRVAILDQTRDTRMFEDLSSRIWDPTQLCSSFNWQQPKTGDNVECVGLGLPIDVLQQRDYVAFDSLVIKLTVYLDP